MPVGAIPDTLWLGAPGEPIPAGVTVRIRDPHGEPLAGAVITWEPRGRDAQVLGGSAQSSASGLASAVWVLGTDAMERQELHVTARWGRRQRELILRARAIPNVVAQLRVPVDTPAILRLGDSLPIVVTAVDPFGNTFPAPAPTLAVIDTTIGRIAHASIVAGPKRGRTQLSVTSERVAIQLPLHVVQFVASITPEADTLSFTSLGAVLPVRYVLHDDKGGLVADTAAAATVADTTIARLTADGVRARKPGVTSLSLAVGTTSSTIALRIQQRVASLGFHRDTILIAALRDTTTIQAVARDSLGYLIAEPQINIQVTDAEIATVDFGTVLQAVTPGVTFVTLRDPVTGIMTSAPVVVRQLVTAIALSATHLRFDALGDSAAISATATDRLGSAVAGAALEYVAGDSSIISLSGPHYVRAVGPGQSSIAVREIASGTAATVDVVVDQVATSLTVASTFGNPVVTLSVGSPFPLTCQMLDRNGYPIARDPVLVGSLKGTVTGASCADARVVRSGYDTLVFVAGNVQARLGVIIATSPDSVEVVTTAQPLTEVERIRFVGENLANPSILALRPLVSEILTAYENPTTSLGRARALRDWVARTAVHPHPALHPDASTANVGVLPPGKTWFDVNSIIYSQGDPDSMTKASNAYWQAVGYDGYASSTGS
jgi:hypothetical protein